MERSKQPSETWWFLFTFKPEPTMVWFGWCVKDYFHILLCYPAQSVFFFPLLKDLCTHLGLLSHTGTLANIAMWQETTLNQKQYIALWSRPKFGPKYNIFFFGLVRLFFILQSLQECQDLRTNPHVCKYLSIIWQNRLRRANTVK